MSPTRSLWALALIASGCLQAAPIACVQGSLLSYEGLGATGCTVGPVTVENFAFNVNSSSGGATPVTDSQITVTPQTGLKFGLGFSSEGFSVTSGQSVEYLISYLWDPSDDISSIDDALDDPVTPPGLVSITTNACVGVAFSGGSCSGTPVTLNVFDNGITSRTTDQATFAPVEFLGVRKIIDLSGNSNGAASFNSDTNEITLPEPATWLSAAVALVLLGVGLARR
jgi:hypothetical protein